MKRIFLIVFTSCITIAACSPYNQLKSTDRSGYCSTTIEGNGIETDKWLGDAPILVTRSVGRNFDYRTGEILELKTDGVMFDEDRRSIANNPEPRFYTNDEVHSLIDESGEIVMGEFPDRNLKTRYYQVLIRRLDFEKKPDMLRIYPNATFSYCAEPGEYLLESITWMRRNGDSDISSEHVAFRETFTIEEHSANYLGDIYINFNEEIEFASTYRYPMKILNRPNRSAAWGAAFGMIGAIIDEALRDRGVIGILELQILDNLDYDSKTDLKVRFTELY